MEHHAAKPHSGGGGAGREPEQHLVQRYETDAYLADEAARALAAGLQAEEAAVSIATQTRSDAIEQPPGDLTARRRVLIVDDNEDSGGLLGEMLGWIGHEVRVATDGPRALEVVETFTPEVAILDIGLPVMDGYALAAALRDRLGPSVRLLAVTGYGREQDRRRVMQSGFDSHFVKPVPLQTVLAAIAVALAPGPGEARSRHE